jgi:hypothetical protein
MTDFQRWEYNNLVRFAVEANAKLAAQEEEIEQLKQDLRLAIDAYRRLICLSFTDSTGSIGAVACPDGRPLNVRGESKA